MERQITGLGMFAGACVVVSEISGRGVEFGGLLGWVVVVCGIVVVGGVVAVGKGADQICQSCWHAEQLWMLQCWGVMETV